MDSTCLPEERIAELVEGRLDRQALALAENHLATCKACRSLVRSVAGAMTWDSGDGGPSSFREPAPLARGDRVGRYVIRELVGAGGMGRVYSAHDPTLDRTVALKLMRPDHAAADLESRLLREAQAMARVTHPNVITVHDAGCHGDEVYVAMELVQGGTLRDWLAEKPRSWREILDVYGRAGRGLAEAHAVGLVHRDFKPDNVLVADGGDVVRVTDFGLARAARQAPPGGTAVSSRRGAAAVGGALTRTGALLGTPVYMAPEQHAGEVADARADIYSFCVALYEALYSDWPFVAVTVAGLYEAKLAGHVRPPDGRGVPPAIGRVLTEGLRPDPDQRPGSMEALLGALASAAPPPRRPARSVVLATAVVAVAGAIGVGWTLERRATRATTAHGAPVTSPGARDDVSGRMVYLPGATFEMGDDSNPQASPQHTVTVGPFWLDATEVTVAAYTACVADGACSTPMSGYPTLSGWGQPGRESLPINGVGWSAARDFCAWAGKRLPSEAEWERAAVGGAEQRRFPWGADEPAEGLCWKRPFPGLPCPVASSPRDRTPEGIFDLAGALQEWTESRFCPYSQPGCMPDGGVPPRVTRGGAFFDAIPAQLRSTGRAPLPDFAAAWVVGIRCAR